MTTKINFHKFNAEESKALYEKMPADEMVSKGCYNNIFYTVMRNSQKFRTKEWKVAFGFMQVIPEDALHCRHCFIVNRQGEAIDPTYYTHPNLYAGEDKQYISFHIYHSIDSYIKALRANEDYPDLFVPLARKEHDAYKWAEGKFIFMG